MPAPRYPFLLRFAFPFGVLAALALAACRGDAPAPVPTAAPAPPGAPADPALLEEGGYLLTTEKVARYFDASERVVRAMWTLAPEERARLDVALNPDEPGPGADDATLDEYAARVAGNEVLRQATEEAGLSPREYAVLTRVMLHAGMVELYAAAAPGTDVDSLARALGADPRNVAFMRAHAAELQERQAELEAQIPGGPVPPHAHEPDV